MCFESDGCVKLGRICHVQAVLRRHNSVNENTDASSYEQKNTSKTFRNRSLVWRFFHDEADSPKHDREYNDIQRDQVSNLGIEDFQSIVEFLSASLDFHGSTNDPFRGWPPTRILDRTRLVTTVFIYSLVNRSTDWLILSILYRIAGQQIIRALMPELLLHLRK